MKNSKVIAQPVSGMASRSLAKDPSPYLKARLWNIRTLNSADNRELLSNTLFSREFDLIALAETHLTSNGSSEIEVTDLIVYKDKLILRAAQVDLSAVLNNQIILLPGGTEEFSQLATSPKVIETPQV